MGSRGSKLFSFFNPEPITIIRKAYSGFDEFGNPKSTTHRIPARALFGSRTTSRGVESERGEMLLEDAKIILDDSVTVKPGDTFEIRGEKWQQDGLPFRPSNALPGGFFPAVNSINIKRGEPSA